MVCACESWGCCWFDVAVVVVAECCCDALFEFFSDDSASGGVESDGVEYVEECEYEDEADDGDDGEPGEHESAGVFWVEDADCVGDERDEPHEHDAVG